MMTREQNLARRKEFVPAKEAAAAPQPRREPGEGGACRTHHSQGAESTESKNQQSEFGLGGEPKAKMADL